MHNPGGAVGHTMGINRREEGEPVVKMVYVLGPRARGPAARPEVAAPGGLSRVPARARVTVLAAPVAEPPAAPEPGAGHADAPEVAAPAAPAAESAAPEPAAPETAAALPADLTVSVARSAADAFLPVVEQQAAWAERRSELEQTYRRLQRQVQAQLSGLRVQLATRLRSRP